MAYVIHKHTAKNVYETRPIYYRHVSYVKEEWKHWLSVDGVVFTTPPVFLLHFSPFYALSPKLTICPFYHVLLFTSMLY